MEEIPPINKGRTPESSDDDDDDEEELELAEHKEKRTTKIPRHMPLGVEVDAGEEKSEKPVRKLSLSERFLQQLETRTPKHEDETEEAHEASPWAGTDDKEEPDTETNEAPQAGQAKTEEQPAIVQESNSEAAPEAERPSANPTELEAADWEPEGEVTVAGETPQAAQDEEFAELPATPAATGEEAPEPVEEELLVSGLGPEVPVDDGAGTEPDAEAEPEEPGGRTATRVVGGGGSGGSRESGYAWYDAAESERSAREAARTVGDPDAEYYAEKRGIRKGLLAGGVFGWMLGRRGKKKAALTHKKDMKVKDKEIGTLKQEQLAAQERLEAVRRTQAQLESQIAQQAAGPAIRQEAKPASNFAAVKPAEAARPVAEIPRVVAAGREDAGRPKAIPQVEAFTQIKAERGHAESAVVAAAEAIGAATLIAAPESVAPASREASTPAQELPPEDRPITEETYEAPDGRRVETSAWHRIEIDEKTGKAVSDPEVAYGEEFKRELRQEVKKDDAPAAASGAGGGAAVGVLGGLAASASSSGGGNAPSTSGGMYDQPAAGGLHVPNPKSAGDPHKHLTAGNDLLRYASSPVTWGIAIVIVLALFVFGILR